MGVEIQLPDINLSSGEFEILTDTLLCIPFNRIKGIGQGTVDAIMEARKAGRFESKADFITRVEKRKCNKRHQEILELLGAFASITPGSNPAKHPDRIKDQRELIPGLITDTVPISRGMVHDKFSAAKIGELILKVREEKADDGVQVKPLMGKTAKFMVISDCPTSGEERQGQMAVADNFIPIGQALEEAGLSRSDGYWTALVKRPKTGKQITAQEIEAYLPYLKSEIEILKPSAIVLLGSGTVRHFMPDLKGKASEAAGKVVYNKDLDCNMIVGFNPGEIYYDPDKQVALNSVFDEVAMLTV
jgi:DNA polymerase-3 subunit alpha